MEVGYLGMIKIYKKGLQLFVFIKYLPIFALVIIL